MYCLYTSVYSRFLQALLDITAQVYAEKPQKDIHGFTGTFSQVCRVAPTYIHSTKLTAIVSNAYDSSHGSTVVCSEIYSRGKIWLSDDLSKA